MRSADEWVREMQVSAVWTSGLPEQWVRDIQADAVLLDDQGSIWCLVCRAPCDHGVDDPKAIGWHFEHCEYANALSPADPKPTTEETA